MRNLIFLFVFLALAIPARGQDAIYAFEEGVEYKYLFEMNNLRIVEQPGQTMTSTSELTISCVVSLVEKLENNHMRLRMLVDNALAIQEGNQQTETFGPEAAGKFVEFELDGKGKVVDIDSSLREMDPKASTILVTTLSIFQEFDISNLSVGSEWESNSADTSKSDEGTNIITETERTFEVKREKEVNGHQCVEIAVKSESDIDGKLVMGQDIMVSGTREGSSKFWYAPDEKLLVKLESEVNTDQTYLVTANNQRVPETGSRTVKIELVAP